MAAQLKDEGDWNPGVLKVRRDTFEKMVRASENPPSPTKALRSLMSGAKKAAPVKR